MVASCESNVRVGVRIRPLTAAEIQQGGRQCVRVAGPSIALGQRSFTFDAVFNSEIDQSDLYGEVSPTLLNNFIEGFNATIMAYGQTGSGKTFTMGSEAHHEPESSHHCGLIPRFVREIFSLLEAKKERSDQILSQDRSPLLLEYSLSASFLEVYGEDIHDLMDRERKALPLRENANGEVVVSGLTNRPVSHADDALRLLHEGTMNRTTASTLMNLTSSRSHAVFTIYLTQDIRNGDSDIQTKSRFTFVDLAGSERMKKTGAEGERAREGIKINEGLLALGNVINALADEERVSKEKSVHVPYRQSKLTRLLQDALGGNSQTLFLACISPADTNSSETLSTLNYANRARNIRNAPTKNIDSTAAEIERLKALNSLLQRELIKHKFDNGQSQSTNALGDFNESLLKRGDVEAYLLSISNAAESMNNRILSIPLPDFKLQKLPHEAKVSVSEISSPTSTERFDGATGVDADGVSVDDVDPERDMAILDHLLELHKHDSDFEHSSEANKEELKTTEGDIEKQEKLLLELKDNMKQYRTMKERYETMINDIQQLEKEKSDLARQLQAASFDPTKGSSTAIKRKLDKVEQSLSKARRETQKHRDIFNRAAQDAKRVQVLEKKIADLKKTRSSLRRKLEMEAARYREVTDAKTKELLALKKKSRQAGQKASKLEKELQRQKYGRERKDIFAAQLSEKLKKTESHLIKLLSIRKQELSGRNHLKSGKHDSSQDAKEKRLGLSDDKEFGALTFVVDSMLADCAERHMVNARYKECVKKYADLMRQLGEAVNDLHHVREKGVVDDIGEAEQNVADVEVQIEVVGDEMEDLKDRITRDESRAGGSHQSITTLLEKMSVPHMRLMLNSFFDRNVDLHVATKKQQEQINNSNISVQSLEDEIGRLRQRISYLIESSAGCKNLETNNRIYFQHEEALRQLQESEKWKSRMEAEAKALKSSNLHITTLYHDCAEKLALLETSISTEPSSLKILGDMQRLWSQIGLESIERERHRHDIAHSVDDTCKRKLQEAVAMKKRMEDEIHFTTMKLSRMSNALGIDSTSETIFDNLNQQLSFLKERVLELEPRFVKATGRRARLQKQLVRAVRELGLERHDLTAGLCGLLDSARRLGVNESGRFRRATMMENIAEKVAEASSSLLSLSSQTSWNADSGKMEKVDMDIPTPLLVEKDEAMTLSDEYLDACESELDSLRVQISEILVANRHLHQKGVSLLRQMNLNADSLIEIVNNQVHPCPSWWNIDILKRVAESLSLDTETRDARATFQNHLKKTVGQLDGLASNRRLLSQSLQQIIESAQRKLLSIVGEDSNASLAKASFHEALERIPFLSQEFCAACVTELDALVAGADAMIQSEVEALTVVWEATGISPTERSKFWSGSEAAEECIHDAAIELSSTTHKEKWMEDVIDVATALEASLAIKTSKLKRIHDEVEMLRVRQDSKSQILSLDAELCVLNSKLAEFEESRCQKNRLLTKKKGGCPLLKEERFRRQMKATLGEKLSRLVALLKTWEKEELKSFETKLLSEEVRLLVQNHGKMDEAVAERTKFMALRTVPQPSPSKRRLEPSSSKKGVGKLKKTEIRSAPENEAMQEKAHKSLFPAGKAPLLASEKQRPQRSKEPFRDIFNSPKGTPLRTSSKPSSRAKRKAGVADGEFHRGELKKRVKVSPGSLSRKENFDADKFHRNQPNKSIMPFGHVLSDNDSPLRKGGTQPR